MHACRTHEICLQSALLKAESICHDRDVRFTQIRRKVLKIIWESHTPAKAYGILEQLNQETATAKPATVYRALDFLLKNGLIHKLNSLNAYTGCSHPLQHDECYFLICLVCNEIKECCDDKLTIAIHGTADDNQFRADNTALEIAGICQECR